VSLQIKKRIGVGFRYLPAILRLCPISRLLRKWPLSYSFFRGVQSHFLPPLSGRSPVSCLSECGFLPQTGFGPHSDNPAYQDLAQRPYELIQMASTRPKATFRKSWLFGPIDKLVATRPLIVVSNLPNSPTEESYDNIRDSRLTMLISISRSVTWLYGSGPTISRIICCAKQLSREPLF
jgi:hypothetical protein